MTILIASTIAPYKTCLGQDIAWLRNAEDLVEDAEDLGYDVKFFCAVERDGRGDDPFVNLLWRMNELDPQGEVWRFSLDDGADEYTSENRLYRICTGRNICIERALRERDITHILHVDTDTMLPDNAISSLLELDYPVTGGKVGVYNMSGPRLENASPGRLIRHPRQRDEFWRGDKADDVEKDQAAYEAEQAYCAEHPLVAGTIPEGAHVREHWNTAGFLLVGRELFSKVWWHYDPDAGNTDDPATQAAYERLGYPTRVRHDLIGTHVKVPMVKIEQRPRHDRMYFRDETTVEEVA